MDAAHHAIEKAFLTAHLLSGDARVAEDIVMQAIDSWNPAEQPGALFEKVVEAALQSPLERSGDPGKLPDELRAVLLLPRSLRCCFVLRILLGISVETCARMLGASRKRVEANTCSALQLLPTAFKPQRIAA